MQINIATPDGRYSPDSPAWRPQSKRLNLARNRYQKGSLHLQHGSWKARWREDVIDEGGRLHRIRRQITLGPKAQFPTKKLAQRQFDLTLARVNALNYMPGRMSTFEMFVERWKVDVLPQREISTQRAAMWHLRRYLLPELGSMLVDQIGQEQAQILIARITGMGKSSKTAINVIGTLSTILRTARSWGYTSHELNWKDLSFPKRTERVCRRFFSAVEASAIIALAESKWPDQPWALLFRLAAVTGMRAGELLGLKWADIDFDRRLICVRRKVWYGHVGTVKTLASERVLPVPHSLAEQFRRYLATWRPNADGWLFATETGKPVMIQHVVQRKLWLCLDDLKIKRCGLHAFRHGHASMLVDGGAPMTVARDQLGHTDMRLTLGVYSHVIDNARREAVERLADRLDAACGQQK